MKYKFAFRGFYFDYWFDKSGKLYKFIQGINPNN